ncbi:MAG: rhomboid family intramembrane serine protease [Pseudobacteriovorax sp.]|nr:rhomboid family intramembrane serine protease [Pseudobacteriovorax sp.]
MIQLYETNEAEKKNLEGDYTELSLDDFQPVEKTDPPQPLIHQTKKESMKPTLFWGFIIVWASVFSWLKSTKYDYTVSYTSIFQEQEFYRLWTSLFIHSDFGHLASNLWLFLIFGYLLRNFWGLAVFPLLTFVLTGGLTSLATIMWYQNSTHLLGASGMIYGMIALWLVTYCRFELRYSFKMRVFRAIGFILVMLFPSTITANVSYSAHFFGFLIGAALGLILILFKRVDEEPKAYLSQAEPKVGMLQ